MHSRGLILAALLAATTAQAADRFHMAFDDDLAGVEVEACFDGAAPSTLYRHSDASRYTEWIRHNGRRLAARERGDELRLPDLPDNACIQWRVNLGRAAGSGDYRSAFRVEDAVLASTGLVFWKGPWRRPTEVRVDLPDGMVLSTPWQETGDNRFRPEPSSSSWSSRIAVGRFRLHRPGIPGSDIRIALPGVSDPAQQEKLITWATGSLRSVSDVFGYFPQPTLQVLIVPIGRRNEPVPWAHVIRGGGPAVEFFVDPYRTLSSFENDWTATHEFSHLLLPFVARSDRWLSEGLASYYQNVLRARDGRLSEREAWQKLHEGFRRGEKGTHGGTLAEATRSGRAATMRVYWSGAAMMLEADARLREQTDGEQNLDTALRALNQCCRQPGRRWRAWSLLSELDRITGTKVFSGVYQEHVYAESFPDFRDIYEDLGLNDRRDRIRLVEEAPLSGVRDEIMQGGEQG